MGRATGFEEETYQRFKPRASGKSRTKPCGSLLTPKGTSWVAQDRPYVATEIPTRSISLRWHAGWSRRAKRSGTRAHCPAHPKLAEEFRPEHATQISAVQETGYSSRRKDKRNGALIYYSQGQCRPYQQSMKLEVEAQFLRLKLFSEELSTTLCRWDGGYRELRQCFAESNGLDWTASQWERFLSFENAFFRLQDELFAVEDEMKQKVAQMYLLVDHTNAPSRRGWLRQDDVTLWPLEGEDEERARNGEHPTLEWNGVDYNATKSSYLDYESLSSIA